MKVALQAAFHKLVMAKHSALPAMVVCKSRRCHNASATATAFLCPVQRVESYPFAMTMFSSTLLRSTSPLKVVGAPAPSTAAEKVADAKYTMVEGTYGNTTFTCT